MWYIVHDWMDKCLDFNIQTTGFLLGKFQMSAGNFGQVHERCGKSYLASQHWCLIAQRATPVSLLACRMQW